MQPFTRGFGDELMRIGAQRILQPYVISAYSGKPFEVGLNGIKFTGINEHGRAIVTHQFGQKPRFRGFQLQVIQA